DYTESGDTGFFTHTVDAEFETAGGLALYGAVYGRYTKDAPVGTNPPGTFTNHNDTYDWGAIAQAGYLITPKIELFGRCGYLHLDDDDLAPGTEQNIYELTAGGNYFLVG